MDNLTPQQILFLKGYTDPKSSTFGNALQSALKAGYSQEYSESITAQMPDWLSENLGKSKIVQKAERNLDMALDGLLDDPEKGKKEIQWKASEFALERLKKQEYSTKTETDITSGGKPIPILNAVFNNNSNEENSQTQ